MSTKTRILELVNSLHHSLAVDANNTLPFAGNQIVRTTAMNKPEKNNLFFTISIPDWQLLHLRRGENCLRENLFMLM